MKEKKIFIIPATGPGASSPENLVRVQPVLPSPGTPQPLSHHCEGVLWLGTLRRKPWKWLSARLQKRGLPMKPQVCQSGGFRAGSRGSGFATNRPCGKAEQQGTHGPNAAGSGVSLWPRRRPLCARNVKSPGENAQRFRCLPQRHEQTGWPNWNVSPDQSASKVGG